MSREIKIEIGRVGGLGVRVGGGDEVMVVADFEEFGAFWIWWRLSGLRYSFFMVCKPLDKFEERVT